MYTEQRLQALEREARESKDRLVNLALNLVRRLDVIEDQLRTLDEEGQEEERHVIRQINSEVRFAQEYYGVKYRFEIYKGGKVVIVYAGRTAMEGIVELSDNPYYSILAALTDLQKGKLAYDQVKPRALSAYTAEEISKEIGCHVDIYE